MAAEVLIDSEPSDVGVPVGVGVEKPLPPRHPSRHEPHSRGAAGAPPSEATPRNDDVVRPRGPGSSLPWPVALGEDRVLVGEVVAGLGERSVDDLRNSATGHHAIGRRDVVEAPDEDAFFVQGIRVAESD